MKPRADARARLATADARDAIARSTRRKIAWRILPLLFLLYVIAYLDRANIGFAKLKMSQELAFSDTVFGIGVSALLRRLPVPRNPGRTAGRALECTEVVRPHPRHLGRLLDGDGAGPTRRGEFYLVRFLLGLAEAGFFPGVIVYFTHWFPRRDRSRALSAMLIGMPISLSLGAYLSGWLLEQHWLDLTGWQWVFLVEGAPAVLLGCRRAVPAHRPPATRAVAHAGRARLARRDAGGGTPGNRRGQSIRTRDALRLRTVWLLALGIFATNIGGYAFVFWLPTVVKGLLAATGRDASDPNVLNWSSLRLPVRAGGRALSGWSSDRTGDRKWHCVAGQVGTGAVPGAQHCRRASRGARVRLAVPGRVLRELLVYAVLGLPTLTLTLSAAAVAIGFINMCANLAGWVGLANRRVDARRRDGRRRVLVVPGGLLRRGRGIRISGPTTITRRGHRMTRPGLRTLTDELLGLYRQMLLIRRCEEQLARSHQRGLIHGACHTYVGQEAIAVGVCAHLRRDDVVFSTHRGHGHALAKGVPPRELIAELFGRATGCSRGRGGSMHLFAPEVGMMGTSGIVGPCILQAAGAGYSFKLLKTTASPWRSSATARSTTAPSTKG